MSNRRFVRIRHWMRPIDNTLGVGKRQGERSRTLSPLRGGRRSSLLSRSRLGKLVGLGSVLALGVGLFAKGSSAESVTARYPYDPACPWGRVADGRGMLVRCLLEKEAQALAKATPAGADKPSQSGEQKPSADKPEPEPSQAKLEVEVSPVVADTGSLPKGASKLGDPKDRYAKCVKQHGGLRGNRGEVHVRFLVRERGRAEGVSVSKRSGVSSEAARCVADVVDRRYVGVPDAPMVGATVIVSFKK